MMETSTGKSTMIVKTAIDLTKKSDMQQNVRQILELQIEVGPLTYFVDGKSVAQLRSKKRKKRKISPFAKNYHLKSLLIKYDRSVITPASSIEFPRNMWWYNNSLMDSNSINSPRVNTLTYIEDINNKRFSDLKWKVFMMVIDNMSPKSKEKRTKINTIVKRVVRVDEIISIATEMEAAGEKETVEMCKDILFDHLLWPEG